MRFGRRLVPIVLLATVVAPSVACSGSGRGFNRQYEYEEDVFLDLDGSATVIVNASIPALVALHGARLPVDARARIERDDVRRFYASPVADVTRVSRPWRRQGRRFIQVRLAVPDIRKLSSAPPFSWASYDLAVSGARASFRQRVAGGTRRPVAAARWNGSELVAFKLHLPSRIFFHNVRDLETNQTGAVERGNILRWEQRLADRLSGVPVDIEVRMDNESILNRTLWLFAGSFAAAMMLLGGLIWWTVRRGRQRVAAGVQTGGPPAV